MKRNKAELESIVYSEEIRTKRDRLLRACDWTQLADSPVSKSTWATYRQELRDIAQQPDFPATVTWPTEP